MSDTTKKEETLEQKTLAETLADRQPVEQNEGETFLEMCERLGLDPRCTCTFK